MAAPALALVPKIVPSKAQFAPRRAPEADTEPEPSPDPLRISALAIASQDCTRCHGSGFVFGRKFSLRPCECVLRAVYHAVLKRRYRPLKTTRSTVECRLGTPPPASQRRSSSWGFKHQEFCADVDLVTRRTLNKLDREIHRLRLRGFEATAIAAKVGISAGNVRHRIYLIQERLGAQFLALRPYPLYPVDEYFHGTLSMRRSAARGELKAAA